MTMPMQASSPCNANTKYSLCFAILVTFRSLCVAVQCTPMPFPRYHPSWVRMHAL